MSQSIMLDKYGIYKGNTHWLIYLVNTITPLRVKDLYTNPKEGVRHDPAQQARLAGRERRQGRVPCRSQGRVNRAYARGLRAGYLPSPTGQHRPTLCFHSPQGTSARVGGDYEPLHSELV